MAPKAATKKSAGTTASHASYQDLIKLAIINLKDRKGSSRQAIKKYIQSNNNLGGTTDAAFNSHVNRALAAGEAKGVFERPKGPSGPVKLKKPAAKVADAPKAAAPKKPAAAKPKAAPKKAAAKPKAAAPKKAAAAKPKANTKKTAVAKPAADKPAAASTKTKTGRVTKTKAPAKKAAPKKTAVKKAAPKKAPTPKKA